MIPQEESEKAIKEGIDALILKNVDAYIDLTKGLYLNYKIIEEAFVAGYKLADELHNEENQQAAWDRDLII